MVADPIAVPAGWGKTYLPIWVFQSSVRNGPHAVKSLRRRPGGLVIWGLVVALPCRAMLSAGQVEWLEWTCAIPGLCRSLGAAPDAACLDEANGINMLRTSWWILSLGPLCFQLRQRSTWTGTLRTKRTPDSCWPEMTSGFTQDFKADIQTCAIVDVIYVLGKWFSRSVIYCMIKFFWSTLSRIPCKFYL